RPIVVAAFVMAAGEALVTLADYVEELETTSDGHSNAFHGLVVFSNFLPFAVTPLLLAIAARRVSGFAAASPRVRHLDVGPGGRGLPAAVALALDDPTTIVAYHRADGSWIDGSGRAVTLGGAGRKATFIERDGEPIAAVEHAASIDQPIRVEL